MAPLIQFGRRWFNRWTAAVFSTILALVIFHAQLARGLAVGLVSDQRTGTSTHALVVDGDRCFDEAARLLRTRECQQALCFGWRQKRLETLNVLPDASELSRREFANRSIPDENVVFLRDEPAGPWGVARMLDRWLAEHSGANVVVLCERFDSGLYAYVCDQQVARDRRWRVAIRALPDRRFDEGNWWKCRLGIRCFFGAALKQLYARLRGEDAVHTIDYDPDRYEARIFG